MSTIRTNPQNNDPNNPNNQPASNDPICVGCEMPIKSGKIIYAGASSYHPDHFQCAWCKVPLVLETYYTIDGQNVCQTCRNKERCLSCGFIITETKYTCIDGKLWHNDCFRCSECFEELERFLMDGDTLFCSNCYGKNKVVGVCSRCDLDIKGTEYVKAMGKMWHDDCFTCAGCGGPFPDDLFSNVGGQPFCDPCIDKKVHLTKKPPVQTHVVAPVAAAAAAGAAGAAGARPGPPLPQRAVVQELPALPARDHDTPSTSKAPSKTASGSSSTASAVGAAGAASKTTSKPTASPSAGAAGSKAAASKAPAKTTIVESDSDEEEDRDNYAEQLSNLPKVEKSKYDGKLGGLKATAGEERKKRDYKFKPATAFEEETSHLNDLQTIRKR